MIRRCLPVTTPLRKRIVQALPLNLYTIRALHDFRTIEHTIRCQHTRERPAAAELGRAGDLRVHVKQYIPSDNTKPAPGDVTLIGAQGNGFPKELYEPMWSDLCESLRANGRRVRGIWIADAANQGRSAVMNEELLGPDASWWDHARDLMFLINQHQDEIPHPIIGIGHSYGAAQLAHLALLHPSLLDSLIMIDPVIQQTNPSKAYAPAATYRRDIWPSRSDAATKFSSSKFYQQWDARVLSRFVEFGLRDLPTEQYPLPEDGDPAYPPVTLTTPKAQEVYNYLRPAYDDDRMLQSPGRVKRDMHPDDIDLNYPFYRPEPLQLYRRLPELRPPVLYILGQTSELSSTTTREGRLSTTGTGVGGNGGAANGEVKQVVLECGHLVPMERPTECAAAAAEYIDAELERWELRERDRKMRWERLSRRQRVDINGKWREHMPQPKRPPKADGEKTKP